MFSRISNLAQATCTALLAVGIFGNLWLLEIHGGYPFGLPAAAGAPYLTFLAVGSLLFSQRPFRKKVALAYLVSICVALAQSSCVASHSREARRVIFSFEDSSQVLGFLLLGVVACRIGRAILSLKGMQRLRRALVLTGIAVGVVGMNFALYGWYENRWYPSRKGVCAVVPSADRARACARRHVVYFPSYVLAGAAISLMWGLSPSASTSAGNGEDASGQ